MKKKKFKLKKIRKWYIETESEDEGSIQERVQIIEIERKEGTREDIS